MFASEQLEDLAKKLYSVLPGNIQNIDVEVQQQFNDILQYTFTKLDLVTREEFDVQVKVLARTREKIEKLETEVQNLLQKKKE
jgi:ubiquinone biosynthesis accessory factor UbiK